MKPRIVITGGPGAGKTAALAVVRRTFGPRVVCLPEAASILFGGGFPRVPTAEGRMAAQRAIFHVQRELEAIAEADPAPVVVCDRGTIDGAAYWPDGPIDLFASVGTSRAAELTRYELVIHLRTPGEGQGYDHANPVRIEDAREAGEIDGRIGVAWSGHPHRVIIDSAPDFIEKVQRVVQVVRRLVPARPDAVLGPHSKDQEVYACRLPFASRIGA